MNARLCRLVYSMRCAEVAVQKIKVFASIEKCVYSSERRRGVPYGQGLCMWCGVEMGWKGLLPKAYPQNVWMCKSPVCGRGGIERRCAHRPRELSLQARGRPRSTPVCAVRIFLSHFRLSGEGCISSIYTSIDISCHPLSGMSCSPRHG